MANLDNEIVRRTIHSFYDNGQYPTTVKIFGALHEKIDYSGLQWSVQHILRSLTFKYKKCNNGRTFLTKQYYIVCSWIKFLRK